MAILLKTTSVRVSSIQIIQVRVQNKGKSVWKSRYDGDVSGNDLTNLTPCVKSMQHNTLQPENGSAHGICWQYNIVQQEQNNAISTCIFGWWKGSMVIVLRKANFFPTAKEYILFNYKVG